MKLISIVVPCYNEQESIPIFYKEVNEVTSKLNNYCFEYIFVDDGSKDNTLIIIKELRNLDDRIKYVSFSRNFGKESGIYAGLLKTKGDYVVLMDVDLQDPPRLLPKMINILESKNGDSVATRRVTRKGEPPIRSFFARMFYKLINSISDIEFVDGARDYRIMTRQMVDSILSMKERNRFTKGIFSWVGFQTVWLEYENIERVAGETKWSFWKLFKYSLEGIMAFSTVPLSISSFAGVLFCIVSFIMMIFVFFRALIWGDPVSGWPSLVCIMLLIGGVQMLGIGILGQYLSKAYLESKNRPIFITKEESNNEEN